MRGTSPGSDLTTSEYSRPRWSTASRRTVLRRLAAAGGLVARVGVDSARGADRSGTRPEIPTPRLHVEGNRLVDPAGEEIILRGICTADPKLVNETEDSRGKDIQEVIDLATDADQGWYARVVHLPVQPAYVGDHDEPYPSPVAFSRAELEDYLKNHLDSAVRKCKEVGAYCIVDYHRHKFRGFATSSLDEEIRMFWDTIAPRYADQSHVLFELYNEPVLPTDEEIDWPLEARDKKKMWFEWKDAAQPWVDLIRSHAPRNLVLIGSPFWSIYPQGAVLDEEFEGDNLVYTTTIYPGHEPETVAEYDDWLERAWEEIPLFVTEWGYEPGADDAHVRGTTDGFGTTMREWLSDRPIHWAVWCFDPHWYPVMFEQNSDDPAEWELLGGDYQGEFTKDFLADYRDDSVPTEE